MKVARLSQGGAFRAPVLLDRGYSMRLVAVAVAMSPDGEGRGDDADEAPTLVYRSVAELLYTYWEGQWWVEWSLSSAMAFFGLIAVLLVLGGRWQKLDVITKVLLLSMLIHIAILLWFTTVEIARSFTPKAPTASGVEVRLLSQAEVEAADGHDDGSIRQQQADISRDLLFERHEESLLSGQPGSELESTTHLRRSIEFDRQQYRPELATESAAIADTASEFDRRAGRSREVAPSQARTETLADRRHSVDAKPRDTATKTLEVVVPGSTALAATRAPRRRRCHPTGRP